jgi:hypothetical protein
VKIILKLILKKWDVRLRTVNMWLGCKLVMGFCRHSNERLGFINGMKILDKLSNC